MYHILRIILYRLSVVSTLTLFCGVVVFWFYGFITAFIVFTVGISGKIYIISPTLADHHPMTKSIRYTISRFLFYPLFSQPKICEREPITLPFRRLYNFIAC